MNEPRNEVRRKYMVTVGHASVTVECSTERRAIHEARRRLSHDMPRLWDVIQTMADNRFQVAVID